jgi:hypothetical protein
MHPREFQGVRSTDWVYHHSDSWYLFRAPVHSEVSPLVYSAELICPDPALLSTTVISHYYRKNLGLINPCPATRQKCSMPRYMSHLPRLPANGFNRPYWLGFHLLTSVLFSQLQLHLFLHITLLILTTTTTLTSYSKVSLITSWTRDVCQLHICNNIVSNLSNPSNTHLQNFVFPEQT